MTTFPDIVTRISSSTIDSVFGSTMNQPKVVLFTDKEDTPGMFRALAASFRKYNLLFYTLHASDEQAKKTFNIQKACACFACCVVYTLQVASKRGRHSHPKGMCLLCSLC